MDNLKFAFKNKAQNGTTKQFIMKTHFALVSTSLPTWGNFISN